MLKATVYLLGLNLKMQVFNFNIETSPSDLMVFQGSSKFKNILPCQSQMKIHIFFNHWWLHLELFVNGGHAYYHNHGLSFWSWLSVLIPRFDTSDGVALKTVTLRPRSGFHQVVKTFGGLYIHVWTSVSPISHKLTFQFRQNHFSTLKPIFSYVNGSLIHNLLVNLNELIEELSTLWVESCAGSHRTRGLSQKLLSPLLKHISYCLTVLAFTVSAP